MRFEEYDLVRLAQERPDLGLSKADIGTIVMVYSQPTLGYEVEFVDGAGRTLAVVSLQQEEIEPMTVP